MPSLATKRVLVYVAAGLVVAVVGGVGLLAARQDDAGGAVVVSAPAATPGAAGGLPLGASQAAEAPLTVSTTATPGLIYVQVAGAVRRPGVYQVPADARVFQVIQEAGGLTQDADEEAVPLATRVSDGCRLVVPRINEASPEPVLSQSPVPGAAGAGGAGVVSLNTASEEELDSLPGIGPSLARQIVEYREAHGPFTSIDQLTDVPGIGPAKLEQIRPLVGL